MSTLESDLLRHAGAINAAVEELLARPGMRQRRLLGNRICDAALLVGTALNTAATRWHTDLLSNLRRKAGLRAAQRAFPDLSRLAHSAIVHGYAADVELAALETAIFRASELVDALLHDDPGAEISLPRAA